MQSSSSPSGTRVGAGAWVLVAGIAAFVLIALEATVPPIAIYDEGVVLASVQRFASGELPWRDYDPVYGPLEPMLLWPFAQALGTELLQLRWLRAAAGAVLAALLFRETWRVGGGRAAAVLTWAMVLRRTTVLAHPAAMALVATAVLLGRAQRRCDERGPRGFAWAGACAGIAGLFRLEFGALAVLGSAAALLFAHVAQRAALKGLFRKLVWFALGGLPALAVVAALIGAAGVESVSEHFGAMSTLVEHRTTDFPLPPPDGTPLSVSVDMSLVFGLPLLVLPLAALAWLAAGFRRRPQDITVGALALCGIGALPYGLSRPDLLHFFPLYALSVALLGMALGRFEQRLTDRSGTALAVVSVALAVLLAVPRVRTVLAKRSDPAFVASSIEGLSGMTVSRPEEDTWSKTVAAVQARTDSTDPVFVGCASHERVFINDGLLYVLCARPAATRHHCFNPGLTTSEDKQRDIVRELDGERPKVIVLVQGLAAGAAQDAPGSPLLDRWIERNYRLAERFGGYGVYVPR